MIKLILFDLDGTLINSLDDLAIAMNYSLEQLGLPIHPVSAYRYFVGNGVAKLVQRALGEFADSQDATAYARQLFDTYYEAHHSVHTKPYEGIESTLTALKTKGITTAVVTNKPHDYAEALVKVLLEGYIDLVIGQSEEIPPKPDPKGVLQAIEKLGFSVEECLFVGDSNIDMKTATAAGIKAVGVTWGFRDVEELRSSGANTVIHHPLELLALLDL
ncbi:MAG: HAD family hydrolase [Cellulosilyticaceae bacterium]